MEIILGEYLEIIFTTLGNDLIMHMKTEMSRKTKLVNWMLPLTAINHRIYHHIGQKK